MHVNVMRRIAPLATVVALSVACTEDKPKAIQPLLTRAVTDAGAAAPAARVDDHTLALARAARDAATALAMKCRLVSQWEESFKRFYDICTWKPADLEPMRAAATAFAAGAPDAGDAAVFAEHVRLFAEWIELIKDGYTQGTLAHYQDLALAWNAFQPKEPIPVDVRAKSSYYDPEEMPPDAGPDGGPLVWQRCSNGACMIVPRKDKR
jgi:hypothetical protein